MVRRASGVVRRCWVKFSLVKRPRPITSAKGVTITGSENRDRGNPVSLVFLTKMNSSASMIRMDTISVIWADGRTDVLTVDEVIFPDRTCGQWDGGWLVFRESSPEEEYFISGAGRVYVRELDVGSAPEIVAAFERELERDREFWIGGM